MKRLFTYISIALLSVTALACGGNGDNGFGIVEITPQNGAPGTEVLLHLSHFNEETDIITVGGVPVSIEDAANVDLTAFAVNGDVNQEDATLDDNETIKTIIVPELDPSSVYVRVWRGDEGSNSELFKITANANIANPANDKQDTGDVSGEAGSQDGPVVGNDGVDGQIASGDNEAAEGDHSNDDDVNAGGGASEAGPSNDGQVSVIPGTIKPDLKTSAAELSFSPRGNNYVDVKWNVKNVQAAFLVGLEYKFDNPISKGQFQGDKLNPFDNDPVVPTTNNANGIGGLLSLAKNFDAPKNQVLPLNYCYLPAKTSYLFAEQPECIDHEKPWSLGISSLSSAYNYVALFLPLGKTSSSSEVTLPSGVKINLKSKSPFQVNVNDTASKSATWTMPVTKKSNVFTLYYLDWSGKMNTKQYCYHNDTGEVSSSCSQE